MELHPFYEFSRYVAEKPHHHFFRNHRPGGRLGRSKTLCNFMLMAMAASPSWTSETAEMLQLAADTGV